MNPIKSFTELTAQIQCRCVETRIAVVCPYDKHTQETIQKALELGMGLFTLVGDADRLRSFPALEPYADRITLVDIKDTDEAAAYATRLMLRREADVLMKGLINTDNLLRVILDKKEGLLPKGRVLTHTTVMELPAYPKLIFFSDPAVIPFPTLEQRIELVRYNVDLCHKFGIETPKVALIHCTEKVSPNFPVTQQYVEIVRLAQEGHFGSCLIDGPLDLRCALDAEALQIKGIQSPLNGEADVLIFPEIESANSFYKTVTLFAGAEMADMLQGPQCPVAVTSRSDSQQTKFNTLALACFNAE